MAFKPGDRVVKNPSAWVANDFDGWGRGIGVGIVVEPPFVVDDLDMIDVQWPAGRCFEAAAGLSPAPETNESNAGESIQNASIANALVMNETMHGIAIEKLNAFSDPEDPESLAALDATIFATDPERCSVDEIDALLKIFERFPNDDGYGVFWTILHFLEACPNYESALLRSAMRRPVEFNLIMINRQLNGGINGIDGEDLFCLLKNIAADPTLDATVRDRAQGFVAYQSKRRQLPEHR